MRREAARSGTPNKADAARLAGAERDLLYLYECWESHSYTGTAGARAEHMSHRREFLAALAVILAAPPRPRERRQPQPVPPPAPRPLELVTPLQPVGPPRPAAARLARRRESTAA